MAEDKFSHQTYVVRKKVFKLAGAGFHVYDPDGNVVFYAGLKAFKLKEDIRICTGDDMETEVLSIQARQILDISASYDVVESSTGLKVGALRRRGMKSIIRDEWMLLDAQENEIGVIKEDSTFWALFRRFAVALIPQSFHAEVGGAHVCTYKQHFNPFVFKMTVDFSPDPEGYFDRRLGLAAAVLLCAIEGRQG